MTATTVTHRTTFHHTAPAREEPGARRALLRAQDEFDASGLPPGLRRTIAGSWRRSLSARVPRSARPGVASAAPLTPDELERLRRDHPLRHVLPVVRHVLVRDAHRNGMVVAVGDRDGRLLWVEGHTGLRTRAEDIGFAVGTSWSEREVGTSAPGVAVRLGQPVQVIGPEHWREPVQSWSCAAAPVRDPVTHEIVGFLDITGGDDIGRPEALTLVRAAVAAAEAHLLLAERDPASSGGSDPAPGAVRRLDVLGHPRLDGRPIPVRHAEILFLLHERPDGLSAEQLGLMLHPRGLSTVTVRAEIARLRRRLGVGISPRPYRLEDDLRTDVDEVRDLVRAGSVDAAARMLGAGLLPGSDSPAVREYAADLERATAPVAAALVAPDPTGGPGDPRHDV